MKIRYRLVCAPGAAIRPVGERSAACSGSRGSLRLDVRHPRLRDILTGLQNHNISETEFDELASACGGADLQRTARDVLAALKQLQALIYEVSFRGRPVARVLPVSTPKFPDREAGPWPGPPRLNPHVYLRPTPNGLHVLAPDAHAEVIVGARLAAECAGYLAGGAARGARAESALRVLQHVLHDAGHLRPDAAGTEPPMPWPFHDLVFHASSYLAGAWGPFGKRRNASSPSGPRRPRRGEPVFDLPDPETHRRAPGFAAVLGGRRSLRHPGPRPLGIADLGSFLSLVAGPNRAGGYPYPSGGGIYSFHVYLAVRRCFGLPAGLYRYLAETHQVMPLPAAEPDLQMLIGHGARALGLAGEYPDAVLVITAAVEPFFARYDAIAYRLALVGAGCLVQNMYLAASALRLAGCALGAGIPAVFSRAAGLNPLLEPSLADFALSGNTT